MPDILAWMDLETTGLHEPTNGRILEAACVLTLAEYPFETIAAFETCVRQPDTWTHLIEDGAKEMHQKRAASSKKSSKPRTTSTKLTSS